MFYGDADCKLADGAIATPRDLYEALLPLWRPETCTPRMRRRWTADNPTLGQCAITAFLAQDLFGGLVFGVPLGDGNFHCFNVVGTHEFDLTSEQFDHPLDYGERYEQFRDVHFARVEKKERYELLRRALLARLEGGEGGGTGECR